MKKIAPSILTADMTDMAKIVVQLEEAGAHMLHLDVMDGHFVPNLTFGPAYIASIRKHTGLCLDVHLMIDNPDNLIEEFAAAGSDIITVHAETCVHLDRTLQHILDCGCKAGLAFNPATSIEQLRWVAEKLDLVLLMTVNPGFGGQSIISYAAEKITKLVQFRTELDADFSIAIDGGVKENNAAALMAAGADILVVGSAAFAKSTVSESLAPFVALAGAAQ